MPAAVIPIGAFIRAEFAVLSIAPPGAAEVPFGVFLLDPDSGALHWRLRADLAALPVSPEDSEYLAFLDADFHARAQETGGAALLASLEDSLSGFLRLSQRERVSGRSLPQLLDRLFLEHVDTAIRPFKTHLPFYAVRAAATRFGEDSEIAESEIEWVRAPAGMRLSEDLFVIQVVGRSMEPLIPDGSRVVFRRIRPGSRQGKRLLIEELGATGSSARFTVKRYTSSKRHAEESARDDSWAHAAIRLEPLNPEFSAFELDPEAFEGKYRVIGEFVQVLPDDI